MVSKDFINMLWAEYPIPSNFSIFGGDGLTSFPVSDLDALVGSCVLELRSDVYVTDYCVLSGYATRLPDTAFAVVGAKLAFGFQGARSVKVTFDASTKMAYCRYYPANLTYRRLLDVDDLPKLQGDLLIYAKQYILWKMADKELTVLKSVTLDADNGQVNLDSLQAFRDATRQRYLDLKEGIFIYTVGN